MTTQHAQPAITVSHLKYDAYQRIEARENFGEGERSPNIVTEYLDLKMNKPVTLKYLGIMEDYEYLDRETGEVKKMEVACFMDKDKNRFVNGGIMLVKTLKKFPVRAEVEITWTDMKATKNGNQKRVFDIKIIDGSW